MAEKHEMENVTANLQSVSSNQELSIMDNETIPIPLLKEILEEGEDSMINPQDDTSNNETDTNSSLNASFVLPSEQLQTLDSIFSLGSQEFFLNNCGSKRLIVALTSSGIPNLKVIFKLHDLKNDWYIVFNRKEWNQIVQHEGVILDYMSNNYEEHVCYCDRICIETIRLFERPCVKFCDTYVDSHCTLALETFQRMMLLKHEIEETYKNLNDKIKDVTKRMKLFMDITFFLLFKSNNIEQRHNYNRLMLFMNKSSNFLDLSSSVADTWDQLGKWMVAEESANNS